jgi:protein-tyrosine phosphatase
MAVDCTFIYANLSVGGGIFTEANMKELAELGITHIIDCQAEFDDTPLAEALGIKVLWLPVFDNYSEPDVKEFNLAYKFIMETLKANPSTCKLHVHCAGGVHRGPMFALMACVMMGVGINDAERRILSRRLIASFPSVYSKSVESFLDKKSKGK